MATLEMRGRAQQ